MGHHTAVSNKGLRVPCMKQSARVLMLFFAGFMDSSSEGSKQKTMFITQVNHPYCIKCFRVNRLIAGCMLHHQVSVHKEVGGSAMRDANGHLHTETCVAIAAGVHGWGHTEKHGVQTNAEPQPHSVLRSAGGSGSIAVSRVQSNCRS
eukprot:scaffold94865_cov27-Tisochrysis_lutea.AAC.2